MFARRRRFPELSDECSLIVATIARSGLRAHMHRLHTRGTSPDRSAEKLQGLRPSSQLISACQHVSADHFTEPLHGGSASCLHPTTHWLNHFVCTRAV